MATVEALQGGLQVVQQLEPEWRTLCEQSTYDAPFHRPELIRTYVEAFAPRSNLLVLAVRVANQLVAVLPLIEEVGLVAGIPARIIRAAANVHTCRFDLLHAPGLRDVAVAAVWRALREQRGWDVLQFPAVPAGGALAALVRHAQREGFTAHAVRGITSPYLSLSPGGRAFEQVLERVDSKFRANLRRRMRKLSGKGTVRLIRTGRADDHLQQFYELERAGWKGSTRTAIVQDKQTQRYYDQLANEAQRFGYLSVYTLECDGNPVAMHYGLTHRDRYFVLKTAYDQTLHECSPGQLITLEVLRDISERGCVELDFLGLPMDWKRDWAPRLRPHADWYVFRGAVGAVLHLVHARARRITRRVLRRWRTISSRGEGSKPTRGDRQRDSHAC